SFDVSLAALDQQFSGQIGITPWWSIRLNGGGNLLAASNGPTGLSVGVLIGYDANIGTTLSLPVSSSIRLGATFDLTVNHNFSLDILGTVVKAIQMGEPDTMGLVVESNTLLVSPGLVAAFGLHPGVGLDIALKYSHSSLDSQRLIQPGNRGTFGPGAFFSFDLAQLISIPVGVGLSYSASIPLDGGSVWHYFNTGIYYI